MIFMMIDHVITSMMSKSMMVGVGKENHDDDGGGGGNNGGPIKE